MTKSRYLGFFLAVVAVLSMAVANAAVTAAPSGDVLKLTAASSANRAAVKYWYWTISTDAYTFQSGDCLEYDVFVDTNNPGLGAVEVFTADGTWFRDQADWKDQNGRSGHPGSDIARYAYNQWFHRVLPVPKGMIGRTSQDFDLAVEYASKSATYISYYDNIVITNGDKVVKIVYKDGAPAASASRGGVEYSCQLEVTKAENVKPVPN